MVSPCSHLTCSQGPDERQYILPLYICVLDFTFRMRAEILIGYTSKFFMLILKLDSKCLYSIITMTKKIIY